jgi:hypothetical protein
MFGNTAWQQQKIVNPRKFYVVVGESLNATILRIANTSLIDLPWSIPVARSFSYSSFLSVQCSPHSHSLWSIVSYTGKGRLRRQPRHRHQKDPFVYRGNHPCLDRNPRYYRIAITAHLAVIQYFQPFWQQSIPCASLNVTRVHCGQSSPVLKPSSRNRSLICQYSGSFVSLDTNMRWDPHMGYVISKSPQISQRPPGSKQHVIRLLGYFGWFQSFNRGKARLDSIKSRWKYHSVQAI